MSDTTYTAAIATASDVVAGDFCDISIAENVIAGYVEDADGNVTPELVMGDVVVLDPIETDVRTDDDDKLTKAETAGDELLAANGWARVEPWTIADNAMYATVERDQHQDLVDEVRGMISDLAETDSRHAIVLFIDGDGYPIIGIFDTTSAEATSEPYIVLVDHDDDLGDNGRAERIDYGVAIARVQQANA